MKKFAAIFAAAVMAITIGACANGYASGADKGEKTTVVQSL